MGYTIAEKILGAHSAKKVRAGDVAVCNIDFCFSQDGTSELVIDTFRSLNKRSIFNKKNFAIVIDHSAPSPKQSISNIHKKLRDFSKEQGNLLFDIGCGICHQVIPEEGFVLPRNLIVGADSHTCTYGALNAFACGLGSTDIAMVLATGKNWFRVPETVKIILKGNSPKAVTAKDIILHIIGQFGANGCTYMAVEFSGPLIDSLNMDSRFTISNMVVEMGAKCGIFNADSLTLRWLRKRTKKKLRPVHADKNANYKEIREFNISKIQPQVAKPHSVDNVANIEQVCGKRIDVAFLGSCTNGRLQDLSQAASILKGKRAKKGVLFVVAPASRNIYIQAEKVGILQLLTKSGAIILPPGCGPCVGTHAGIPADGQVVLSTANRNFKGRMGNPKASIYLASALTLAASVIEGKIADPKKYLKTGEKR